MFVCESCLIKRRLSRTACDCQPANHAALLSSYTHAYTYTYLRCGRVLLVDDTPVVGLDRVPTLPPLQEEGAPDGEEDVVEGDPLSLHGRDRHVRARWMGWSVDVMGVSDGEEDDI